MEALAPAPAAMAPPPIEAVAPQPVAAPAPAPMPAPTMAPAALAPAPAPAPVPHKPLVDETDWRVSRPAARPAVRATEPIARPLTARPVAAESRSPNLFQRITGAFAAPRPATPAAAAPMLSAAPSPAPVEPPVTRTAPENVVAVAPKPAPRPAPVQTSILEVSERAKPARDDDDLQIPAFLRRQAN
jgi:cell division protein FtsZ